MAGRIEQTLGHECCNLAGKTSVRQLMSLIKRCNFFITNDSGPMHIAAAFRIPLVAVFGPTDHRTTYPYCENSLIVRKEVACAPCLKRECPLDHRCMKEVTAQEVIEAAKKVRLTGSSCTPLGGVIKPCVY
jgi:heptosyltransferase-2